MTPYVLCLELTLILAAWLGIGAWQRDANVPGRLTYAAASLAVVLWCAGDLIDARGEDAYLLGRRVRTVGVLALTPLWLGVAAHAVKLELIRRNSWLPAALMVPPMLLYPLLFAGPWSVLFIPAVNQLEVEVGPLFWVFLVYAYVMVIGGFGFLAWGAATAREPEVRRQRLLMALAVTVPFGANVLAVWPTVQDGISKHDPTAMLIGVTLIAFRRSIFSGGVLDVVPLAQRDIIHHLPFGVVLANGQGTVLDVNPAGEELLQIAREDAMGRALEAVISHAPLELRIEVSTVQGRGGESARFALIEAPKTPDSFALSAPLGGD